MRQAKKAANEHVRQLVLHIKRRDPRVKERQVVLAAQKEEREQQKADEKAAKAEERKLEREQQQREMEAMYRYTAASIGLVLSGIVLQRDGCSRLERRARGGRHSDGSRGAVLRGVQEGLQKRENGQQLVPVLTDSTFG